MQYLTHVGVACPRCRVDLSRYVEEDLNGTLLEELLLCARATGGCGLVVADTAAETVEALSCD